MHMWCSRCFCDTKMSCTLKHLGAFEWFLPSLWTLLLLCLALCGKEMISLCGLQKHVLAYWTGSVQQRHETVPSLTCSCLQESLGHFFFFNPVHLSCFLVKLLIQCCDVVLMWNHMKPYLFSLSFQNVMDAHTKQRCSEVQFQLHRNIWQVLSCVLVTVPNSLRVHYVCHNTYFIISEDQIWRLHLINN